MILQLEISETLPLNKPTEIHIPPVSQGEYAFHRQMQMYIGAISINLKTAVKSRKSPQSLTASDFPPIELITNKVTTSIEENPVTASAHESFPRLTAVFRIK